MKYIKEVQVKKAVRIKCDCCGKDIIHSDQCTIDYQFGYGSKRDGDRLSLDFCPDCIEQILGEKLLEKGLKEGVRLSGEGL